MSGWLVGYRDFARCRVQFSVAVGLLLVGLATPFSAAGRVPRSRWLGLCRAHCCATAHVCALSLVVPGALGRVLTRVRASARAFGVCGLGACSRWRARAFREGPRHPIALPPSMARPCSSRGSARVRSGAALAGIASEQGAPPLLAGRAWRSDDAGGLSSAARALGVGRRGFLPRGRVPGARGNGQTQQ